MKKASPAVPSLRGRPVAARSENFGQPAQLGQLVQGVPGQVVGGAAAQPQTPIGPGAGGIGLGDPVVEHQRPVAALQAVEEGPVSDRSRITMGLPSWSMTMWRLPSECRYWNTVTLWPPAVRTAPPRQTRARIRTIRRFAGVFTAVSSKQKVYSYL